MFKVGKGIVQKLKHATGIMIIINSIVTEIYFEYEYRAPHYRKHSWVIGDAYSEQILKM